VSQETKQHYRGELRMLNRSAGRQKLQQFNGAEWKDIPEVWEDSEIQAHFERLQEKLKPEPDIHASLDIPCEHQ
jgi:hypothetical protein